MTAKEYLQQIRKLDILITQRRKELEELRLQDGVRGISYEGDRVQTSPKGEANYVRLVEKRAKLEGEINELITELYELRHKIINEIQLLDNDVYTDILYKRYVEYMSLERIAVEMHYSYFHTCKLHGGALKELERKIL